MMADLRGKGKILHRYKGPVGSVRQIAAHPKLPYFASVGLDRYMRIHHTESRRLLFEVHDLMLTFHYFALEYLN